MCAHVSMLAASIETLGSSWYHFMEKTSITIRAPRCRNGGVTEVENFKSVLCEKNSVRQQKVAQEGCLAAHTPRFVTMSLNFSRLVF